jgi:hypothetical protein
MNPEDLSLTRGGLCDRSWVDVRASVVAATSIAHATAGSIAFTLAFIG